MFAQSLFCGARLAGREADIVGINPNLRAGGRSALSVAKERGAAGAPSAGRDGKAFLAVVGIGASAGGLDAFRRFFSTVPTPVR